jgi:hypothetical protein
MPSLMSIRKFSRMGITGLVETTPEICERFFRIREDDTTNCMLSAFKYPD